MPVFTLKSFTILFIEGNSLSLKDGVGNYPLPRLRDFQVEPSLPMTTHSSAEILRGVGPWGPREAHVLDGEERRRGGGHDLILEQPPLARLDTC